MPRLDTKTVGRVDSRFDYLNYGNNTNEDDEYADDFEQIYIDNQVKELRDRTSLKIIDNQSNQKSILDLSNE